MGEDVGKKGGVFRATQGLQRQFGPLRVVDTPIAEIGIAGVAIGAAMMGLRPVAEFQFADYMHPAFDQIVSQAATLRWRSVGGFGCPRCFAPRSAPRERRHLPFAEHRDVLLPHAGPQGCSAGHSA